MVNFNNHRIQSPLCGYEQIFTAIDVCNLLFIITYNIEINIRKYSKLSICFWFQQILYEN